MRIIAGERRGWKLESPRGKDVSRPISDRVKENLFNIIQGLVPGAAALDLFAGVGSMGLEALSRGARWVTFVEQSHDVVGALRRNVAKLQYEESSRIIHGSALRLREGIRDTGLRDMSEGLVFDVVFVDPPYEMLRDELCRRMIGEALEHLAGYGGLAPGATVVVRRESRSRFEYDWPGFRVTDSRRYGSMTLDFLGWTP